MPEASIGCDVNKSSATGYIRSPLDVVCLVLKLAFDVVVRPWVSSMFCEATASSSLSATCTGMCKCSYIEYSRVGLSLDGG